MKTLLLFTSLLLHTLLYGQANFVYIDNDFRFTHTESFLATVSLIFFTEGTDKPGHMTNFCTLDSTGSIQRTSVHGNQTAQNTRIEKIGDNHVRAYYYNLYDYDIIVNGFYIVDYYHGNIDIQFRDPQFDLFFIEDITQLEDGTIIISEGNKIIFFDVNDEYIKEIELPDNHAKLIKGDGDDIVINDYSFIFSLNQQWQLDTLFEDPNQVLDVVIDGPNHLLLIRQDTITRLDRTDNSVEHRPYTLDNINLYHYFENHFYIIQNYQLKKFSFLSNVEDVAAINPYPNYRKMQVSNKALYLLGSKTQTPNRNISIQRIDTDMPANWQCADVIIDSTSIDFISAEESFGVVSYLYYLKVHLFNRSDSDVDSVDVFTSDLFQTFFGKPEFGHKRAYNLAANQPIVVEGGLQYFYWPGNGLTSLDIIITAADHKPLCDEMHELMEVTDIVSKTHEVANASNFIFPNPVKDKIYLKNPNGELTYAIYNMLGTKMQSGIYTDHVSTATLAPGNYIIDFGSNSFRFVKI